MCRTPHTSETSQGAREARVHSDDGSSVRIMGEIMLQSNHKQKARFQDTGKSVFFK